MNFRTILSTVTVAALAALPFGPVTAAPDEVVIGVIYPLSGPVAQAGIDAVAALNTAVEIINGESDLNVPLAKGKGLPNLGGAKIRIVVADHQGKPDIGQGEAERMITQEGVHAMYGAYYSSVTAAGSQVAERHQIPWVNGESTSPKLTKRGFKWFFRTTPHDGEFTQVMFEFLADLQKEPARLMASASTMKPVNARTGTSERSRPLECFLNAALTSLINGMVLARSVLNGERVITPSASLPRVERKVGSV